MNLRGVALNIRPCYGVKFHVKFHATLPIIGVATLLAILVITEVIALADMPHFPRAPAVRAIPVRLNLIFMSNGKPPPGMQLSPGIYETAPFAIMIKVPPLADNRCVLKANPQIAIETINPQLKTIPK
jgi:hypothetical protein